MNKPDDNLRLLFVYYDSCNALLEAFCEKHGFDYEDAHKSWVAGCVGETVCCGDYFFDMDVIVTDLKKTPPKGNCCVGMITPWNAIPSARTDAIIPHGSMDAATVRR